VSERTAIFIAFAVFSGLSLLVGYTLRRRNLLREEASRVVHLHTVIWLWSPVSVVAFWRVELGPQFMVVMLIQPILMLFGWACAAGSCRLLRLPPGQAGVMALAAALTNQGFTLGAYLCYTLLEPAVDAMSYAIAFVTSMQVFMVLIFYPVARRYELRTAGVSAGDAVGAASMPSLPKLVFGSFFDIRAMPLYGALLGLSLNLAGFSLPWFVEHTPALDIAFFVGAAGSYLGIGLRLRIGDLLHYKPHHAALAVTKFVAMPGLAWVIVALLARTRLGLDPLPTDVVLISAACPSAINTVIVSNLFHLNARLASILWLTNTALFAIVVLPVILVVF
jgi:predicted permease